MKILPKMPFTTPMFGKLAMALSLALTLGHLPVTAATEDRIQHIVLVHGAFTDGSSWAPVISRLQTMGYHVTAVQNHLTSLADDVTQTEKVLRRQAGKVLLVGHSWGGAVISQAGNAPNVAGLAYMSALTPDSGESATELLQRLNVQMTGLTPDEAGLIWVDQPKQFKKIMADDLPLNRVRLLSAVQQPVAAHSFAEPVTQAAWRTKPSWYLLTNRDQALPLAAQKTMAQQIGARVQSVPASHLSMISRPLAVSAWIDRAAREAAKSATH